MMAAGVEVEATAPRELVAAGDSMPVTVTVYNRGTAAIKTSAAALGGDVALVPARTVLPDSATRETVMYYTTGAKPTTAWWLERPLRGDTFTQPLTPMITGEDRLH